MPLKTIIARPLSYVGSCLAILSLGSVANAGCQLTIYDQTYTESGCDVIVTYKVKLVCDPVDSPFPISKRLDLWEDDIIFDDFLGGRNVKWKKSDFTESTTPYMVTYTSKTFTITFAGASNACLGYGDDYYMVAAPEPGTFVALGVGGFGLLLKRRRQRLR